MRCGAYAASDLARNVRRCCLGFEHVVMGTEAEAQCKSGVLDILPSIYGYVQPAYKQCVSGPHLCHGSWWGKKALSCREQGWDSHEMCLRVVADFMHTASLLIRRATTFYQLGEPADITKKAKNAITLCDHRTLTMFNRADEMLPQLPFVARNTPIPQPGVDVDQADGKVARAARKKGTARKREDMISPATEIERGLVWPQWHAQSVCVARLFRFIEKHGTAFGDPHDM